MPSPRTAVAGQFRAGPLSATLTAARAAAQDAGVSRLGDVTGLTPYGVPVFQAVRPRAKLLSVAQGKGLTPMAAMVSALLEAVEADTAERLPPVGALMSLDALPPQMRELWGEAGKGPFELRLRVDLPLHWARGENLASGAAVPIPWDLLSLDLTRRLPCGVRPSTIGLASGNNEDEAVVGALAELLEHDFAAANDALSPINIRGRELDLDSVDDPNARALLDQVRVRGGVVRVWSMGQEAGIAAFHCALCSRDWRLADPPAGGSGCHPDRRVALIRAVLEAVQSRATMVAGGREDLAPADYANGAEKTAALVIGSLGFGPGPLAWSTVPHAELASMKHARDILLRVATERSRLPILLYRHRKPHPDLSIVHAIAPGLAHARRAERSREASLALPRAVPAAVRRRPILFVGPTLADESVPDAIDRRPPAVCGDLARLLADPPPAIGLVDGCFEIAPTVWHKEIMHLLSLGVTVVGGASLGALRAAELAGEGMIGVGTVFEAYRSGQVVRDDAVMVCHAPAELGFGPLTVALVDAEAALNRVAMPATTRRVLQRIVRTTGFRDRSWARVLAAYRERVGEPAPMTETVLAAAATLKRDDARAVLAALLQAKPKRPATPPLLTAHYLAMLASLLPAPLPAPSAPANGGLRA